MHVTGGFYEYFAALRSRRRKAQDRNDIAEEAKICNAIGDVYMRQGILKYATPLF